MRIAQLANFVGPTSGGIKTALERLGRGYVDAGAERLLVVPGERDRRTVTAYGEVVQLRAPRVSGGYRLIVEPWRVVELVERFAPTSVEVSDKSTLVPVSRWARRRGVPTVLFSHERLDAMLSLRTGLEVGVAAPVRVLNRFVVGSFDRVVVTSSFAAHELAEVAERTGTTVHRVPLGVDLQTFRPATTSARPDGPLRLVHAGRLSREKSPRLAVETALHLHRRGVPLRLDVYGTGHQAEELRRLAHGAPVVFHGHVPDRSELARRLAAADVALSVCPGETFGLAVLEALACGTPVVTASSGGARELVDETCGAWGDPEPAALGRAVLELAARPRAETRRAARTRAEGYCWSATVRRMVALHAELAGPEEAVGSADSGRASCAPPIQADTNGVDLCPS